MHDETDDVARALTERDFRSQAIKMAAHGLTAREWSRSEKILVQNFCEFGGLTRRHAKQIIRESVNEFLEVVNV